MAAPSSYRLVVADDEPMFLNLLTALLQASGFEVLPCSDGREALQIIQEQRPHVAILDQCMPGLDGRSICRHVREAGLPTRLILVTNMADVAHRVAGLDAGAHDYVCKPFDAQELRARVRVQLREWRPTQAPAPAGEGLQLHVLGDFRMRWQGSEVPATVWKRRQPRTLLKFLLLHHDRMVSTDLLLETFWPDTPLDRARGSLHVCVRELRRGLAEMGGDRLLTAPGGYTLALRAADWLDLAEFERLLPAVLREMQDAVASEEVDHRLARLMDLYRGDLFSEEPYAEWALAPRERMRAEFCDLLGRAARRERRLGRVERAVPLLRRLMEMGPEDETRCLDLAEALLDLGDRAGASQVLLAFQRIATEELGVSPSPRWDALHAMLSGR